MKKIILLAFVALGCNTITKEEAHKITTEYIKDYVFKERYDIDIHKMEVLDIQYIDSKKMDSVDLRNYEKMYSFYKQELERQKQLLELGILPSDFDFGSFSYPSPQKIKEEKRELEQSFLEANKGYEKIKSEIKNRKLETNITYAKVLLKSTSSSGKRKVKYFDTLDVFIDKNKKVIYNDLVYSKLLFDFKNNW